MVSYTSVNVIKKMSNGLKGKAVVFSGVDKWFGDFQALKQVDLSVLEGEIVVVCGPSGSGKSTLIRCINGLESYDSGDVQVFNSANLTQHRGSIGMVFQHFHLFPHLTVLENLILSTNAHPKAEQKRGAAARHAFFTAGQDRGSGT